MPAIIGTKDVAIYLIRRHSNETLADIGKYFNMPNYSSVSSAIERVKAILPEDRSLRGKVAKIEKILNKSQRQTPACRRQAVRNG
jgi:chromosomal replication initiation ATPase DnaA